MKAFFNPLITEITESCNRARNRASKPNSGRKPSHSLSLPKIRSQPRTPSLQRGRSRGISTIARAASAVLSHACSRRLGVGGRSNPYDRASGDRRAHGIMSSDRGRIGRSCSSKRIPARVRGYKVGNHARDVLSGSQLSSSCRTIISTKRELPIPLANSAGWSPYLCASGAVAPPVAGAAAACARATSLDPFDCALRAALRGIIRAGTPTATDPAGTPASTTPSSEFTSHRPARICSSA